MTAASVLTGAVLLCLLGAVAVLPVCRNRRRAGQITFGVTALAGLLAATASVTVLVSGPGPAWLVWPLPEYGSSIRLALDGLSAVFVLLIALISTLAAAYSIDYMAHYPDYGLHRYCPYFLCFVAGTYTIVTVTDLMAGFFLCWQLMTLPSFALVRFEWKRPASVRAAWRYLVAMEVACGLVMLGAAVLAQGPVALVGGEALVRFDFDAVRHGMPALLRAGGGLPTIGLLLLLLGFGIKAGLWPFGQWWLPAAHPAAPSPVSALLSGVLIKTGVYGLMRSFVWLIPAEAAPAYAAELWGAALAILGTVTLFIGTTQALGQDQSKRLLAYSSIGQIGYIVLAFGASLALLQAPGALALAGLAFAASLYHTINHATYKSLLFLSAGSLLAATDTQDLNRMGGLIRYLPFTAATTLVGSLAIAGVPLLNGFVSKWSLFVSAILGSRVASYLAVCAAIAMLTSVITLALFLKFFGTSFLSRVSREVADRAARGLVHESGWSMLVPQIVLAGLCLGLGLVPQAGFGLIQRALWASRDGLGGLLAEAAPVEMGIWGIGAAGRAVFAPALVAAVFGLLLLFAFGLSRVGSAARRTAEPWLCGYAPESDRMRYGARNLYREVLRALPWVPAGDNGTDARAPQPTSHHKA
jgi:hydrogenase-4 component B